MIWLIFALMAAVAVAILARPLIRTRAKETARVEYDLAVYKDQLNEIDRDLDRGLMSAEQADAARIEVQRRMLAASEAGKGDTAAASPRRSRTAVVGIAAIVPAVAFAFYAVLGSPHLPNLPHAGRTDERAQMQEQAAMFRDMVQGLAAKLEQNPNDAKGWAMMGRSLRVLGEPDGARDAYKRAIRLAPEDPQMRLEYGAMLLDTVPEGAPLPPEFVQVMKDVLALDPGQADALYFLGLAAAQNGDAAEARRHWTTLLNRLPPDSPDRPEIERMIQGL